MWSSEVLYSSKHVNYVLSDISFTGDDNQFMYCRNYSFNLEDFFYQNVNLWEFKFSILKILISRKFDFLKFYQFSIENLIINFKDFYMIQGAKLFFVIW